MDLRLRDRFLELWRRYFDGAEIPIAFFYSDDPAGAELLEAPEPNRCVIADLVRVRAGRSLCFSAASFTCADGKRSFGFPAKKWPYYEHFVSCGIPGEVEGLRYKQSPDLVRTALDHIPRPRAPKPYLVFKRWDTLGANDTPLVVVFFVGPDELSGLFMLAHFDEAIPDAVVAPFGPGCTAIGAFPLAMCDAEPQQAVLGTFDPSARSCLPESMLTFAVPMAKLERMVGAMEESFLETPVWRRVQMRIAAQGV